MKLKCSKCKVTKECRSDTYRKRLSMYGGSVSKLLKKYICQGCRRSPSKIESTESYKNLKNTVNHIITKYSQLDMSNQIYRQSFLTEVDSTMKHYKITNYNFKVENSKIESVIIHIPIVGELEIKCS